MAKKDDMTKKTDAELAKLVAETRTQIRTERFTAAGARPKDPSAARKLRRIVARALTERGVRKRASTQNAAEPVTAA